MTVLALDLGGKTGWAAQALDFEPSDDNAADAVGVPLCRVDRFGKPGGALL